MTALIVGVIALSSVGAFLIGERLLGWSAHSLRTALDSMLECVGATFVFCAPELRRRGRAHPRHARRQWAVRVPVLLG